MGSSVASGLPLPIELSKMWLSSTQWNSLLYWDNPRDSGIICGSILVCLLAVRYISLVSVIGNLSLALVTATMSFRIYRSVLTAVNKTNEGHPFKQFLDVDVTLPADKVSNLSNAFFSKLNKILLKVKSLLLVENAVESVKFAVSMYLLTYVGAILNGLTLITLAWVAAFSAPRVSSVYQSNFAP